MRLITIAVCLLSFSLFANNNPAPKGYSLEKAREYQTYNTNLHARQTYTQTLISLDERSILDYVTIDRPFSEYKRTKYVVINDGDGFESRHVKQELAKNLPDDVTLVILTSSKDPHYNTKLLYGKDIAPERLKVITVPQAHATFWARDALPVPVISTENQLFMVDALYDRPFSEFYNDKFIADYFNAGLIKHNYRYEGGNFMPNDKGVCLAVKLVHLPEDIYKRYYGCKEVILLPFVAGIGHVDERVKFLSDTLVVTDEPSYKSILESHGLEVIMLPNIKFGHETYANSLLVNGTLFMPIYNRSTDAEAIAIYEAQGLKVVPINTRVLSNRGLGSIHCITMGYPDMDFLDLENAVQ